MTPDPNWYWHHERRPIPNQKVIYFYEYVGTFRGYYYEEMCEVCNEIYCSFGSPEHGSLEASGVMWCTDYRQAIVCPDKRFPKKNKRKQ